MNSQEKNHFFNEGSFVGINVPLLRYNTIKFGVSFTFNVILT